MAVRSAHAGASQAGDLQESGVLKCVACKTDFVHDLESDLM
jgi:hypothetical protein